MNVRLLSVAALLAAPLAAHAVTYSRTVTVAQHLSAPYNDPVNALATITDASPDKPYLLKIEPGVYDLGTRSLQGVPYVDIEGSGEGVTILQNGINGRLFTLAASEEVRALTFRRPPGAPGGVYIVLAAGAGSMRNVTIRDSYQLLEVQASATFDRVTVTADPYGGTAVAIAGGSPVFTGCTLTGGTTSGTGVLVSFVETLTIRDSTVYGSSQGVVGSLSPGTVRIVHSTVKAWAWPLNLDQGPMRFFVFDSILDNGTIAVGGGAANVKCVQTYTPSLDPAVCAWTAP